MSEIVYTAPGSEIPMGTRAVVIKPKSDSSKKCVFDLRNLPYGISLAQLISNSLAAFLEAGISIDEGYSHYFVG